MEISIKKVENGYVVSYVADKFEDYKYYEYIYTDLSSALMSVETKLIGEQG